VAGAILSSSGRAEAIATELGGMGINGSNQNTAALKRLVDAAPARWGRIDAVVNSAGHGPKRPVLVIGDQHGYLGMEFYLLNVVRVARLVTPVMQRQRVGSIVNIPTCARFEPEAAFPTSGVFRAGLRLPSGSPISTRPKACAGTTCCRALSAACPSKPSAANASRWGVTVRRRRWRD
jgi:NAD(P)-dependent dehydrogenase (short-subunit alcohol dehydrogenase family)